MPPESVTAQRIAVVTDSTASLPTDLPGLAIVSLRVVLHGRSRPEVGAGSTGADSASIATALHAGEIITTSQPSEEDFVHVYRRLADEGYTGVVSVHLSAKMSGTCAVAARAAQRSPIAVRVIDSRSIAMALGHGVLAGHQRACEGGTLDEVAAVVQQRIAASETFFCVSTLEYLRRGGRIGTARALLGSALAVKPILCVRDGEIVPFERVRTSSRALARLI